MVRTGPGKFVRLQAIVILCEFYLASSRKGLFFPQRRPILLVCSPYVIHSIHTLPSPILTTLAFGSQKFCTAISQHGAIKPSKADTVQRYNSTCRKSRKGFTGQKRDESDEQMRNF